MIERFTGPQVGMLLPRKVVPCEQAPSAISVRGRWHRETVQHGPFKNQGLKGC